MDEFSNLVDAVTQHDKSEKMLEQLCTLLSSVMALPESPNRHRWGIIATGFKRHSPALLKSGVMNPPIHWHAEDQDLVRPLLVHVMYQYKHAGRDFPTLLWEVGKSNPGLLGEVYQQCVSSKRAYFSSFSEFSDVLYWKHSLVQNLTRNYPLLKSFLKAKFTETTLSVPVVRDLVDGGMATETSANSVDVVPFAFVVIGMASTTIVESDSQEIELQRLVQTLSSSADERLRSLNEGGQNQTAGAPFENFVYSTLRLRGLFVGKVSRVLLSQWFTPSWHASGAAGMPAASYELAACNAIESPPISVQFVFGADQLKSLLSPMLYGLFPIGCEVEIDFIKQFNGDETKLIPEYKRFVAAAVPQASAVVSLLVTPDLVSAAAASPAAPTPNCDFLIGELSLAQFTVDSFPYIYPEHAKVAELAGLLQYAAPHLSPITT